MAASTITDGTAAFKKVINPMTFTGMILAYSGNINNAGNPVTPEGVTRTDWHLCDGSNGTPDLRGRFILGGYNATYTKGKTGGEATHTLNGNEVPWHNHTGTTSTNGNHTHNARLWDDGDFSTGKGNDVAKGVGSLRDTYYTYEKIPGMDAAGGHNHNFTTSGSGGGQAHNNMPPYYTLAYIMKL